MSSHCQREPVLLLIVNVLFLSGLKLASSFENKLEICPDIGNVALNKVANQTGTSTGSNANNVVDGVKDTCSLITKSTSIQKRGVWWFVDLRDFHQIYNITICSKQGYFKDQPLEIQVDHEHCASYNRTTKGLTCVTLSCMMAGQYVSVINQNGKADMSLCEVIVMGHPYFITKKNVAYGKKVTQVGTSDNSNGSEKVIDLCKDTCVHIDSTDGGREPGAVNLGAWLVIDLGGNYTISEITVCNSNNFTESQKLEKFSITVDHHPCAYHDVEMGKGICQTFSCTITGRYVMVHKKAGKLIHQMTLCEIVVLGQPSIENVAFDKHSGQADYNETNAQNVVDGVHNQCSKIDLSNNSKNLNSETMAWWYVDLGKFFKIMNITVCNSMDENDYRFLINFDVIVDTRICHFHPELVGKGECATVNCALSGRYITIRKNFGENMGKMALCEVIVMGYPYNIYQASTNAKSCFTKTCGNCNPESAICVPVDENAEKFPSGVKQLPRNLLGPITKFKGSPIYSPYLYSLVAIPSIVLLASVVYWLCKRKSSSNNFEVSQFDKKNQDDTDSRNYDIFISYRTSDDEERLFVVKTLFPYLKRMGYNCCLDVKDFLPGHSISDCILKGIEQSRGTILVISPAFLRGEWPEFELQVALQQTIHNRRSKHLIIPVIYKPIDQCKQNISPTLEYILKSHIYIEWTSGSYRENSEFWKKLNLRLPKLRSTYLEREQI